MGQEKSTPHRNLDRNNNINTITKSSKTSCNHRHHHHRHSRSQTDVSASSYQSSVAYSAKSATHQTKYLNEHLYIKSYLDIEADKRKNIRILSEQAPSGLRNYTPKILSDKSMKKTDAWV